MGAPSSQGPACLSGLSILSHCVRPQISLLLPPPQLLTPAPTQGPLLSLHTQPQDFKHFWNVSHLRACSRLGAASSRRLIPFPWCLRTSCMLIFFSSCGLFSFLFFFMLLFLGIWPLKSSRPSAQFSSVVQSP